MEVDYARRVRDAAYIYQCASSRLWKQVNISMYKFYLHSKNPKLYLQEIKQSHPVEW